MHLTDDGAIYFLATLRNSAGAGLGDAFLRILPPCDPCDTNCDGSTNGSDIESFVALLNGTGTPCSPCAGDTNRDGSINGTDIEGFINCLNA